MAQDCWGPNLADVEKERREHAEAVEVAAGKISPIVPELLEALGQDVPRGSFQIYMTQELVVRSSLDALTALELADATIRRSLRLGTIETVNITDLRFVQLEEIETELQPAE